MLCPKGSKKGHKVTSEVAMVRKSRLTTDDEGELERRGIRCEKEAEQKIRLDEAFCTY